MFVSKHSHHGIPTRGHLHHGIPTKRHLHHVLNMCADTIMDKLCISITAWDIYIIRICIPIFVKKHLYQNQKSRLASHFACIEKLTFKLMVQSLSSAWLGAWYLYFAFVKTKKDERGIKQIRMKKNLNDSDIFIHARSYMAWRIASDICFLI